LVFDLLDRVFCFAITPGPLSCQRLSCTIGGSGGSGYLMALCRRQRRRSFPAADTTAIGPVRNRLAFRILAALDLADGDYAVLHCVACNIGGPLFSLEHGFIPFLFLPNWHLGFTVSPLTEKDS